MIFEKLASAIRNNVVSGLQGYHNNYSFTLEQVCDDIVDERLQIIKEYQLKGIAPFKDLALSINCIPVDCKSIEKCGKCSNFTGTLTAHFEVPQILTDYDGNGIIYIGSVDKLNSFRVYTSPNQWNILKYRRRSVKNKPFVYIDTTPNENNMCDGYIFNAPLIKQISIIAVFKDPRQLENLGCCDSLGDDNFSFINNEIKKRLTEKYLRYYRAGAMPLIPNDLTYKP